MNKPSHVSSENMKLLFSESRLVSAQKGGLFLNDWSKQVSLFFMKYQLNFSTYEQAILTNETVRKEFLLLLDAIERNTLHDVDILREDAKKRVHIAQYAKNISQHIEKIVSKQGK